MKTAAKPSSMLLARGGAGSPGLAGREDGATARQFDTDCLPKYKGALFRAGLSVAELNEKMEPQPHWAARAVRLSCSHIVVQSRRMCYPQQLLVVAVHMIDATPVPLFGRVKVCEYVADGQYAFALELVPAVESMAVNTWLSGLRPRVAREALPPLSA